MNEKELDEKADKIFDSMAYVMAVKDASQGETVNSGLALLPILQELVRIRVLIQESTSGPEVTKRVEEFKEFLKEFGVGLGTPAK